MFAETCMFLQSRRGSRLFSSLLLLALCSAPVGAQVYASEHALAQQTANGTVITVEYYRPVARGRALFGSLVKYGRPWTPGANWATTIDVDHDVTLEGQPLPKGKYSIWAVPQADAWTVMVSRRARAFHTIPPPDSAEQLRFTVKPVPGPHVEMLTWSFPVVTKDGAELHMQWGTTDIPLHVGIGPSAAMATMTAEERAKYVGVYQMTYGPRSSVRTSTFTVYDSAGALRLLRSVAPDGFYDLRFDLVKRADGTFHPLTYRNGAVVGLEPAIIIAFTLDGDRATELEVRGVGGTVVTAHGVREGATPITRSDTLPPRPVDAVAPGGAPAFVAPTTANLSGAWATGSGTEPTARYLMERPRCNYSPGFWSLQQQGDTVWARTVHASQAQGIARQTEPSSAALEGRIKGGTLVLGDVASGYRLRFDPLSGHLRGTFQGAPFWAVPMQIIRPTGCIPVP